jgi:hypothetical protein
VGWIAQQLVGGSRDPWWDPDGRSRRRSAPRRFLEVAIVAVVLATLVLGLRVGTARAATTVNLDQWASLDLAWQNGNLNGNNARYPEGGVVPFRLAIEGLAPGGHTIRINYDVTAGGHKAYDFIAAWNAWTAPNLCGPGGAVSSLCPSLPAAASGAIPADPFVMDGLSVTAAQVYSGAPRRITIWGGTITSVGPAVHAGPVDGNSTADVTVRFTSTGSAVLLAWGGHLAQSAFWNLAAGGSRDGAGEVSGAPWHMRTLQLDGSGNRNQDRSIQPSAIVGELPPAALAPPGPGAPAVPAGPGTPVQPAAPAAPAAPGGPGVVPTPPPTATAVLPEPAGLGTIGPWVTTLIAMLVGLLAASRRRTRR